VLVDCGNPTRPVPIGCGNPAPWVEIVLIGQEWSAPAASPVRD